MENFQKVLAFLVCAGLLGLGFTPAYANQALKTSGIETCKVKTDYDIDLASQPWWRETNVGFPKSNLRLPGKGTIKAAMIYVQFSDIKGSGSPRKDSKQFTSYMNRFISSVSRNQLNFSFSVPNRWFSIPKRSGVYQMDQWNQGNPHDYAQDALNAADPFVDFKGVDVVYVIPPKNIKQIVYGPAFPLDSGGFQFTTDEGPIMSMAVAGADSRNFPDRKPGVWIVHETGHLFGMPHPYAESNIAAWDLMHWDNGVPEFLGWNRFINGWVADDEVICIDLRGSNNGSLDVAIEPLSRVAKGKKLVVLRTESSKVIVLENRRATKFDRLTSANEGTIAYEVNLKKYSGSQIRLLSKGNFLNGQPLGTMRPGQSLTVEKITIDITSKNSKADALKLSVRN